MCQNVSTKGDSPHQGRVDTRVKGIKLGCSREEIWCFRQRRKEVGERIWFDMMSSKCYGSTAGSYPVSRGSTPRGDTTALVASNGEGDTGSNAACSVNERLPIQKPSHITPSNNRKFALRLNREVWVRVPSRLVFCYYSRSWDTQ